MTDLDGSGWGPGHRTRRAINGAGGNGDKPPKPINDRPVDKPDIPRKPITPPKPKGT